METTAKNIGKQNSNPAAEANAIFIGQLKVLGTPPKFRSGRLPATQTLTFEVMFIEKGAFSTGMFINVLVTIVENSRFVIRSAKGVPSLNPLTFKVGRLFRVFVKKIADQWHVLTDEDSILPVSLDSNQVANDDHHVESIYLEPEAVERRRVAQM